MLKNQTRTTCRGFVNNTGTKRTPGVARFTVHNLHFTIFYCYFMKFYCSPVPIQTTQWVTQNSTRKGKGKGHPITVHEGPEGKQVYSSTLPSTSALDVVGGQRHAPAALSPGKTRYPLYRRLGWPQDRSGRVWKISPPSPGFDPRTVQPVASQKHCFNNCCISVFVTASRHFI